MIRSALCLNGWEGRTETPVFIIGETAKRYRIRAIQRTKLAGRNRWLDSGETALVPKSAVRLTRRALDGASASCQCDAEAGEYHLQICPLYVSPRQ